MSTSIMDCDLCGEEFEYESYGNGVKCPKCGQIYDYDERQIIRLSEKQKEALRKLANV